MKIVDFFWKKITSLKDIFRAPFLKNLPYSSDKCYFYSSRGEDLP